METSPIRNAVLAERAPRQWRRHRAWAAALVLALACTQADARDTHPHLRQAAADLRAAYALIQCGPPSDPDGSRQDDAVREIQAALADWKGTGLDTGTELATASRIDPPSSYSDALRGAIERLQQARDSLRQSADSKSMHELRQRLLAHVELALRATEQALSDFVEDP